MNNSYESICQELDSLAVLYLTKLNEYTHEWKYTANDFKQGYLDLAHAKYTMGARTISHYSYDERMKALLQVKIDDQKTFTAKSIPPTPATKEQQTKTTDMKKKDEEKEGLRKRHEVAKKKNSEWVQITEENSSLSDKKHDIELDEKKNKKKIKKSGDPLYWFGLFVSPSLRTSQEHFKSATEKLIHQVNRINELKSIEKRYQELQQEKILLKLKETKIQDELHEN